VTIVVPVLMINCQVSENWKMGPVSNQTAMVATAKPKAAEVPDQSAAHRDKRAK